MVSINLELWIILGVIINFLLLKNDPELKKEHWLGLGLIILLRSVSGGVISNYLFSAGLGGLDLGRFTLLGILPVTFLIINRFYHHQLT